MSRIAEALRRASLVSGMEEPQPLVGGEPSGPERLADYPEETPVPGGGPVSISSPPSGNPRLVVRRRSGPGDEAYEGKLVLDQAPPFAVEQYRRLAATLHQLQILHGTKTVMTTSALPREGKTLTVTNLALTLSESFRRRVLLIDADFRRPSIHDVFRLPNASGLSEGLGQGSPELSLLQVSSTLTVLPAGRPRANPMQELTSDRMQAVLEEAARSFDWVLLDAPPVGILPDANLLARLTDGVLFVIAAGVTPHSLIERAVSAIGRESIIGTVLNRVDEACSPESAYYHDYYRASV